MIIDNKKSAPLYEILKSEAFEKDAVYILSKSISINALDSVRAALDACKLVNIMASGKQVCKYTTLLGSPVERSLNNQLKQQFKARRCMQFIKQKKVALRLEDDTLDTMAFLFEQGDESTLIQGSLGLTAQGCGLLSSRKFSKSSFVRDSEERTSLKIDIHDLWNTHRDEVGFKETLLESLNYLASHKDVELIYQLCLNALFNSYDEFNNFDTLPNVNTGFKDTKIWELLYPFQKDGVLGAIEKLNKFNGCIIADSVGLGKTFEALAVIRYFELRNQKVLVICPKKLRANWDVYTINDINNPLSSERFGYDVLNHTDLSRETGYSGSINLETLNWGNYDLIVIDESHNFKNVGTHKSNVSRYQKLMRDIIQSGVKTKVLMLSATPVNNKMNDIKNQIKLITEGKDDALSQLGLVSIDNTLRKAQANFNQWLDNDTDTRNAQSLMQIMNVDYFKLLDIYTIARSRKHIERYYDTTLMGKFPERLKPINVKADIDIENKFPPLKEVNQEIKRLNLAAYKPLHYVLNAKRDVYNARYNQQVGNAIFYQEDRESSLVHLMRVNLLKRMESSIYSFHKTVESLLDKVTTLITKMREHNYEHDALESMSIDNIDEDDADFEEFLVGNRVKVLIQDIDQPRWLQELQEDKAILERLLLQAKDVSADRDAKLLELRDVIETKLSEPFNPDNKKVIIFTAFANTAEYLYSNLSDYFKQTHGLETALITGSGSLKCTDDTISREFNNLLTHFSPVSKKLQLKTEQPKEIDILIATDCISEGQNLQDCDTLVNYDIHWNPMRIIQRFGRIDRLGSTNDVIQLVNFWPNMELDEYIKLESRVKGRMMLLDLSATGEDNPIDSKKAQKEMNDLEYRRRQMYQLQETVLDIEDMDGSISITDMTLNDFRMNLEAYREANPERLEGQPTGLFAVVDPTSQSLPEGALFCLHDTDQRMSTGEQNALAPFYLVYVKEDGEILLNHHQAKQNLDILQTCGHRCSILNPEAIERLENDTQQLKDMSLYRQLLDNAVDSIVGKNEEEGVNSLFSTGGTRLSNTGSPHVEDFDIVGYVIFKKP